MGWPFLRGQARDLRKDSLKGNIKIDRERERDIYIYILQARETRVSWADPGAYDFLHIHNWRGSMVDHGLPSVCERKPRSPAELASRLRFA